MAELGETWHGLEADGRQNESSPGAGRVSKLYPHKPEFVNPCVEKRHFLSDRTLDGCHARGSYQRRVDLGIDTAAGRFSGSVAPSCGGGDNRRNKRRHQEQSSTSQAVIDAVSRQMAATCLAANCSALLH
ncbi:hypothetical protein CTA1_12930 [Colletotrichum tanaceti]|uniref:Uncharacterized protein n=1 Tax=Colletotrichum tanaceti TaxID=1306861 RepID=A0A4U6XBT5_9PEZI|nr:hypothetical protein CTA1_12930 [Colletotrichum tanaceti]